RITSNRRYSEPCDGVYREIYNLSQLEDCRSIPKLLGYAIERQVSSDELPGGYIAHIVMQKQYTDRIKNDVCLDAVRHLEYWGLIEGKYEGVLFFEKDKLLGDLKVRLYSE
ncbi:hypothetical protein ASPFODRAFT_145327, partial [Aspergillus luchuensis CBS 106.47]